APDLFSRTTGCFRIFWSAAANGRPDRSAWPPGGYGLTIVIGRDGNASCAAAGAAPSSTRIAKTRNLIMRPPVCGAGAYRAGAAGGSTSRQTSIVGPMSRMRSRLGELHRVAIAASWLLLLGSTSAHATPTESSARGLRLPFIANVGQVDARVAFYAPTFAGTV